MSCETISVGGWISTEDSAELTASVPDVTCVTVSVVPEIDPVTTASPRLTSPVDALSVPVKLGFTAAA